MISFKDKVVALTGAASGIGREMAVQLAGSGAHLALADRNVDGLEQTAILCASYGVMVRTSELDVTQREQVQTWARNTHAEFGRVDIVINNAGVALGSTVEDMSYDDLEWVMGVNFWGAVHGSRAFLPYLQRMTDARIVNISSAFGLVSMPGQGGYNASKFAIRGFTESLSMELDLTGSPVRACCVFPGGVKSNIARSARIRDNLRSLTHMNAAQAQAQFESRLIMNCDQAARQILAGVRRGKRRIVVGKDARGLDLLSRMLPSFCRWMLVRLFARQQTRVDAAALKQRG